VPGEDMQIIHAVFAASVMREGFGKELAVHYFSFYSQIMGLLLRVKYDQNAKETYFFEETYAILPLTR
jgi:hypothetical protein